jgi:hypothetical protein
MPDQPNLIIESLGLMFPNTNMECIEEVLKLNHFDLGAFEIFDLMFSDWVLFLAYPNLFGIKGFVVVGLIWGQTLIMLDELEVNNICSLFILKTACIRKITGHGTGIVYNRELWIMVPEDKIITGTILLSQIVISSLSGTRHLFSSDSNI